MNTSNSFRQFVKDGLVSVPVVLIIFVLFSLLFRVGFELGVPMLFMPIIAFIGSGVGGRFFENVSTGRAWIKPAFLTALISWVITCVLIFLLLLISDWQVAMDIMPIVLIPTGFAAGIGFVSASLIGIIFNPAKRVLKILIGAIVSTITGSGLLLLIYFFSIMN